MGDVKYSEGGRKLSGNYFLLYFLLSISNIYNLCGLFSASLINLIYCHVDGLKLLEFDEYS